MTAEEFLKTRGCGTKTQHGIDYYYDVEIVDVVAFAKFHVKKALNEIYEKAKHGDEEHQLWLKEFFDNYPLENIK